MRLKVQEISFIIHLEGMPSSQYQAQSFVQGICFSGDDITGQIFIIKYLTNFKIIIHLREIFVKGGTKNQYIGVKNGRNFYFSINLGNNFSCI